MNKREIDEFRSAALEFEATGKYCKHDPNTLSGKKFWVEQARRSVKGYHIGSDYISGYNYFYLNFSPIKLAVGNDSEGDRIRGNLSFSFPHWWDFDKLYFDYLEEAEASGEHAAVLKCRRRGYEQPNSELVLTPNGYKNIGSLKVGDIIMNPNGNTTKVVDIFPQGEKDVYEITLHDNRKVKCGLNHLWRVYNSKNNLVTVTTKYLLKYNLIQGKNREKNAFTFHIPEIKPLEFEKKDLRIHPYILGCLIGDGGLTTGQVKFSVEDRDISTLEKIITILGNNYEYKRDSGIKYTIISKTKSINQLHRDICFYGLNKKSYNKFIPEDYKYSSIEDRLEIVRGLMDTDGTSSPNGTVRFTSSSEKLIDDLSFILRSLGIRCAKQKTSLGGNLTYFKNGLASIVRDTWVLSITTDKKLFYLERKQNNIRTNRNYNFNKIGIEKIEKLDYKEECTCILVDNPNHLYITRDCIPTHNSFKGGSMCNRNYFLIPRSSSYIYASDKAYLIGDGGILSKAWDIMSFVDEHTPWTKRRQSTDTTLHKRSSYKVMENGTYIEKGFKSEIVGITIGGDWNRVRGKQGKLILWEEAGCHLAGTKVIMFDGTFKNVEDVKIGDKLMGPDSNPRCVLELHSGEDKMYKITPKNGIPQIVNSKHPIYVEYQDYYNSNPIRKIITAKEYLDIIKEHPKRKYHYSLIRPEIINFNKQEVKIDPYVLGLWLGDGDSDKPTFTNIDIDILEFLINYAEQNNLKSTLSTSNKGTCFRLSLHGGIPGKSNWLTKELRNLNILNNKNIPDKYIFTDEDSRLKLLAGLIDTDGSYNEKKHAIEISQHEKRKDIIFKAAYIARSLGMKIKINTRVTRNRKIGDYILRGGELHYRLIILYGYEKIPCLLIRKRGKNRKGFLRNPLSTRFDITYHGFDKYYGFTLDRDHLFLTEDFTITHNTNAYLLKAYNAALPSLKQGKIVYGLSVAFGTGGSEGQDFMGLEELFFNPKGHEIHPMKNIWEDDELGGYCGFFHPEWANMDGYMDECGNSKKMEAIAAWEKELDNIKIHAKNPDAVIRFMAEHPIKPSQALLQSKHNEFPVIEIKKTLAKLLSSEQMQDAEFIGEFELDEVSGRYKWKPNPDLNPIRVFPLDLTGDNSNTSIDGCWVIYEHPILDENNQVTWGRYIAGTDPVDDDRDDSLESESLQSTFILDTWTDRIVAEYSGRPYNVETYYENLRRGLLYYNATCNYEQEKKGLYTYFKNKNSLHLLADNLEILSDRGISMFKGEGNRSKGTMGTQPVQKHGRDLIKTYLVNVSPGTDEVLNVHRLRSIPLLKELMYWNPDGNFDRVSALSMLMLYRAEKYSQIKERKTIIKSKLENSRILERNKINSYGKFNKINQLFHK